MFYSAGSTDDTRQALMYLNHKYPDAPLLGLGFSLGANLLTRYLGEEGERSKLKAGAALGCVSVLCMVCSMRHRSPFLALY
jgi:predicted alpha/beta-fold hydrolase